MAIPPIEIPNLNLESLSPAERAALDKFLQEILDKLNELRDVVNANHP